jgi:hypothetical protein
MILVLLSCFFACKRRRKKILKVFYIAINKDVIRCTAKNMVDDLNKSPCGNEEKLYVYTDTKE